MSVLQFLACIFATTMVFLTIVGCMSIKYDYKKLETENELLKERLEKEKLKRRKTNNDK